MPNDSPVSQADSTNPPFSIDDLSSVQKTYLAALYQFEEDNSEVKGLTQYFIERWSKKGLAVAYQETRKKYAKVLRGQDVVTQYINKVLQDVQTKDAETSNQGFVSTLQDKNNETLKSFDVFSYINQIQDGCKKDKEIEKNKTKALINGLKKKVAEHRYALLSVRRFIDTDRAATEIAQGYQAISTGAYNGMLTGYLILNVISSVSEVISLCGKEEKTSEDYVQIAALSFYAALSLTATILVFTANEIAPAVILTSLAIELGANLYALGSYFYRKYKEKTATQEQIREKYDIEVFKKFTEKGEFATLCEHLEEIRDGLQETTGAETQEKTDPEIQEKINLIKKILILKGAEPGIYQKLRLSSEESSLLQTMLIERKVALKDEMKTDSSEELKQQYKKFKAMYKKMPESRLGYLVANVLYSVAHTGLYVARFSPAGPGITAGFAALSGLLTLGKLLNSYILSDKQKMKIKKVVTSAKDSLKATLTRLKGAQQRPDKEEVLSTKSQEAQVEVEPIELKGRRASIGSTF